MQKVEEEKTKVEKEAHWRATHVKRDLQLEDEKAEEKEEDE